MGKQRFVNNFDAQFAAPVKAMPSTGDPDNELDFGILRLTSGAASFLTQLTNGDWFIVTGYKKSGSVESNVEIMKITAVDNSVVNEFRIYVKRAQEGTQPQSYMAGDYIGMRYTAGSAANMLQIGEDVALTPAVVAALGSKVDKVAGKGLSTNDFGNADVDKLAGIAEQATKNATDAQLRSRSTHTGEQAIATVTGLQAALDGKAAKATTLAGYGVTGVDITGNIVGDFSNADLSKRSVIRTNTANSNTSVVITPTGTGANSYVSMASNQDQANCSLLSTGIENGIALVNSSRRGSGAYIPLSFFAGGEERMRLDASGRVSVTSPVGFGYGPGAGGTVTQSGNKTATVTLNKASGQITLFTSTLDVNGAFLFSMDNTTIGAEDTVIANMDYTTPDAWMYSLSVAGVRAGSVIFRLHNREGPAKTVAEKINFAVIKGARA